MQEIESLSLDQSLRSRRAKRLYLALLGMLPHRNTGAAFYYLNKGFFQSKPGNLAKSPSFVNSVARCSMA
jgi:hypothetical protein